MHHVLPTGLLPVIQKFPADVAVALKPVIPPAPLPDHLRVVGHPPQEKEPPQRTLAWRTTVEDVSVNYYPPCPDPTVTMGLLAHCDRHLLTVLSQADIAGLQARKDGRWLLVRPVPDAFIVNFGHQMEIVANGVLASVEHRAITNSAAARMSVATHVHPMDGCLIRPAPQLVDEAANPVKYREFLFSEFMEAYDAADASREDVLKSFKIHHD